MADVAGADGRSVAAPGGPGRKGREHDFAISVFILAQHEAGEAQTGARPVAEGNGGVQVTTHPQPARERGREMAVLEESIADAVAGLPLVFTATRSAVVVALDQDHLEPLAVQPAQPGERPGGGGGTVDDIADEHEGAGLVILEQGREPGRDIIRSPERPERALAASAQFVAEVQIGDREPAIGPMMEREPAVENEVAIDPAACGRGSRGKAKAG